MTWFQNSAEHEVRYARAHAMITDVIEASLELGWKGWEAISNVQAAYVAKTSIRRLIRWHGGALESEVENAGPHHKQSSAGGS